MFELLFVILLTLLTLFILLYLLFLIDTKILKKYPKIRKTLSILKKIFLFGFIKRVYAGNASQGDNKKESNKKIDIDEKKIEEEKAKPRGFIDELFGRRQNPIKDPEATESVIQALAQLFTNRMQEVLALNSQRLTQQKETLFTRAITESLQVEMRENIRLKSIDIESKIDYNRLTSRIIEQNIIPTHLISNSLNKAFASTIESLTKMDGLSSKNVTPVESKNEVSRSYGVDLPNRDGIRMSLHQQILERFIGNNKPERIEIKPNIINEDKSKQEKSDFSERDKKVKVESANTQHTITHYFKAVGPFILHQTEERIIKNGIEKKEMTLEVTLGNQVIAKEKVSFQDKIANEPKNGHNHNK
ncbi:MAG: hypothetical protein J0H68_03285 [Sphingobacteriia bacterium]|nr:hypothetical protein [Sphingobacteriia bacterium]